MICERCGSNKVLKPFTLFVKGYAGRRQEIQYICKDCKMALLTALRAEYKRMQNARMGSNPGSS